jgi:hypothetical protein
MDIEVEAFSEKYLGLPTAMGWLTSESFDYIEEMERSKMNSLSEKQLSYAANEVLLNLLYKQWAHIVESAYFVSLMFCVLDNNIRNLSVC